MSASDSVGIDVRCEVVHYPYPPLIWNLGGLKSEHDLQCLPVIYECE